MYLKNDSSPKPIYAILVNASDGSPITSGVAAYHIQGTTRTAGAGTLTHIANGRWCYVPTQAETNYDAFAIDFYHANAVGQGALVEVVTATQGIALITEDTSAIKAKTDAYLDAAISSRSNHAPADVWAYTTRILTASIDPTAAQIADAVWDELRSQHTTTGTYGAVSEWAGGGGVIDYEAIADAVWDEARNQHTTSGTFGAVSEWSTASSITPEQIWTYTTRTLTAATNITSNGSTIDQTKLANLDAAISTRLAASSYTAPDNASIAAIKAKTDKLQFDTNNYVYAVATAEVEVDYEAIASAVWDSTEPGVQELLVFYSSLQTYTVASDGGNTAQTFKVVEAVDSDKILNFFIIMASGTNKGQIREVTDINITNNTITLDRALDTVPTAGDKLVVVGYASRG